MGRTLHYGIEGNISPTKSQYQKLLDLCNSYNEKYNWTCENVHLGIDYYPNWEHFRKDKNEDNAWDIINQNYNALKAQGLEEIDIIYTLEKMNYVLLYERDELRGFTKVCGNEDNAYYVINFVLDCSKVFPKREFYLHDEGDALYCPLLIKNGLAKPDLKDVEESLRYWKNNAYLHSGNCWDVTNAEKYYKRLLELKPDWGDISQYVRPIKKHGTVKPFETVKLSMDEMNNIGDLTTKFLEDEQAESAQFFEDVKSFPIL